MSREIRPLQADEVETLVEWAIVEGWNPGLGDAAAFRAADPDGFVGAFVAGELAAGIAAVAYGSDFGFIGLYIAGPEFRGQGHGRAVWDAGLGRLVGRTVGLDGVPAQQANYRRMGFVPAYETLRLIGRPPALTGAPAQIASDVSFDQLTAYDRLCFPAARETFLRAWLQSPRVLRVAVVGGVLAGFGVVRPCHEGHKIGPLFADSSSIAQQLLAALADAVGGPVQIDVPLTSDFARNLADGGMVAGFSTTRMYRGPAPQISAERIFGVTSLELG